MKGSTISLLTLMALSSSIALAQNGFEDEINNELDQMYSRQNVQQSTRYDRRGGQVVGNDQVVEVGEGPNYGSSREGQPIYIYNSANPSANAEAEASQYGVQTQPTTVVQAQPLSDSRAERIRQARQNAEMNTEVKIVEELERSRMRDERRRADRLFGDRLDEETEYQQGYGYDDNRGRRGRGGYGYPQNNETVVAAPSYQGQTQIQTVEVKETAKANDDIKDEIQAAVADLEYRHRDSEEFYADRVYVNGILGFGDYPDAINVRGNLALGVAVGTQVRDRMLVEGSFLYGNYDIEHVENGQATFLPEITSMDQYTVGGTFKYQIFGGMLRPFVGGTMAYQYRSFTKTQFNVAPSDATSHAMDVGAVMGGDIKISDDFTIGVDYRYLWNVYSRTDTSSYQQSFVNPVQTGGTPIEEMNQSLLSVTARVSF